MAGKWRNGDYRHSSHPIISLGMAQRTTSVARSLPVVFPPHSIRGKFPPYLPTGLIPASSRYGNSKAFATVGMDSMDGSTRASDSQRQDSPYGHFDCACWKLRKSRHQCFAPSFCPSRGVLEGYVPRDEPYDRKCARVSRKVEAWSLSYAPLSLPSTSESEGAVIRLVGIMVVWKIYRNNWLPVDMRLTKWLFSL